MITPLLHRILVKQFKLEETNKDYHRAKAIGIIISEHEDNKRAQAGVDKGIIVAIGPTAYKDFGTESPIKVGDAVAFARFSGKLIIDPEDDEEYVALNDEDIVAILTGDKNG
jgi:co-chaperonin GroES (HSP10)